MGTGLRMVVTRKTISLPDDACRILQQLTDDCGMDASQCITQLLRRHSGDIHNLFSLNVSNRTQSYAVVPTNDVNELTNAHTESVNVESIALVIKPESNESESPADELARLRALKPMERMKHSKRIEELKQL